MKIIVEVGIFMREDASGEVKEKEKKLREKLQAYVVGNVGTVLGDIYRVEYKGPMFMEIMMFWEDTHQLDLYIEYFFECTDYEVKQAKMFMLNPTSHYVQSRELYEYPCENCGCMILADKNNIKVSKTIKGGHPKRLFKFGQEMEELICVSIDLYNYLIENGIHTYDFSLVYKGKRIQAYAFTPEKEYNIISSVYDYKKCSVCGREYAFYNIEKGYEIEKFDLCDKIDFSEHDVFKTTIYYQNEQRILMSPKLFFLIKDYIKSEEALAIFE